MSDHVPPVPPPEPPVAPPAPQAAPPVPQYGEYAPPGYISTASPQAPAPGYVPVVARKRRTWDVVLTIILLVFGVFGVLIALGYAAIFANPDLLDQALQQQGYGGFSGDVGTAPVLLAVSHIVLFLLAAGLSIPLLVRGKFVVFWIPLVAGVIAAIVFWSTIIGVLTSDPSFLQRLGG